MMHWSRPRRGADRPFTIRNADLLEAKEITDSPESPTGLLRHLQQDEIMNSYHKASGRPSGLCDADATSKGSMWMMRRSRCSNCIRVLSMWSAAVWKSSGG